MHLCTMDTSYFSANPIPFVQSVMLSPVRDETRLFVGIYFLPYKRSLVFIWNHGRCVFLSAVSRADMTVSCLKSHGEKIFSVGLRSLVRYTWVGCGKLFRVKRCSLSLWLHLTHHHCGALQWINAPEQQLFLLNVFPNDLENCIFIYNTVQIWVSWHGPVKPDIHHFHFKLQAQINWTRHPSRHKQDIHQYTSAWATRWWIEFPVIVQTVESLVIF